MKAVLLVSLISTLFLLYGISNISISYSEAEIFFYDHSFLAYFTRLSTSLFGQNDFTLRIPLLILHIITLGLMYKISKQYLKKNEDRLFSLIIFALLPGVNSAAILVNSAGIVIILTLFYIFVYQNYQRYSYVLLPLYLFVDNSFATLYISLAIYGYFQKDKVLLYLNAILFIASMYIFGFDTGGKPSGHFMDALGVYAAIFSPFVFIFFFYTMYKILIKGEKNILWYISFSALAFSLLLSFRQKLLFDDFAPFVVLSTPLMVKTFFESFRVRMPRFRKIHFRLLVFVLFTLTANYLLLFFNKQIYHFLKSPNQHFAYKYHIAKELSFKLKKQGINAAYFEDEKMQLRVKFYGIKLSKSYIISSKKLFEESKIVTIRYNNFPVKSYYVTKVNN